MESFITKIEILKLLNIENFEIPLSEEKRQHLIITGKNGTGKTTLLNNIAKFLGNTGVGASVDTLQKAIKVQKGFVSPNSSLIEIYSKQLNDVLDNLGDSRLTFSKNLTETHNAITKGEFLIALFEAKRSTKFDIPQSISKLNLAKSSNALKNHINSHFVQHLVNLKADRSFARDDGNEGIVQAVDEWFEQFTERLRFIFDDDRLELRFDRREYSFDIVQSDGIVFDFNAMSDGYSSIISIVSEILLRIEALGRGFEIKNIELQGIVLIDEIETHLHVDLQKKILPFLTSFFPKIQFIVTTHSPFVLSSIPNATICDLEAKTVVNDLSAYSYDALVESYFDADKYSGEVKKMLEEYERLALTKDKVKENESRLKYLKDYFAHSPKYLSRELFVKLQQIQMKILDR